MTDHTSPRTVEAVQTTLDIIDVLRERDTAGVTELATELGRSKGTIHSHLATLLENEYIVNENDGYRLGFRYLEIGEEIKDRISGYDVVVGELDKLAEKSGEVVQFATHEHGWIVYLYKSHGEDAVQTSSSIGSRKRMHCTSLGKAMLAFLPKTEVATIFDRRGLPQHTENTSTTREALWDDLDVIRRRGYAFDEEELIQGIHCVAVPVRSNGGIFGAISISGPSTRMSGDRYREKLPDLLMQSANVIELNTKFG